MLNSYINNQAKIMETIEERLLFLEKESKEDKNQIQELILNKEDNQINKEKNKRYIENIQQDIKKINEKNYQYG